ncbi:MAG: NUMOD4 domain-containing protein [Cetobacterium sp.]
MIYERRAIEGYEGKYEVDNYGNVFSLDRYVNTQRGSNSKFIRGQKLKLSKTNKGYLRIELSNGVKSRKKYSVHRLVAMAFVDGFDEDSGRITVNHIDGVKTNNKVSNLEWMNHSEQQIHAIRTKLVKVRFTDEEIRFIRNFVGTNKELCDILFTTQDNICHIKSKKIYAHVE